MAPRAVLPGGTWEKKKAGHMPDTETCQLRARFRARAESFLGHGQGQGLAYLKSPT